MKRVQRLSFTLLEMLVVLCLLTLGLSLTAIKIKAVYEEQRFLSEVGQIVNHLRMAQDLMVIMDINTEVRFNRDPETRATYYQLKMDRPWKSRLFSKEEKHVLSAIHRIEFNGEIANGSHEIVIKFYSKGLAMDSGKLILSAQEQKDHDRDYQICLAGYPDFIESRKFQQMTRPAYVEPRPELFPKELLDLLDANKKNQK